jgi:LmbE family N-acetylglucosaminyl deacetylase|tara:strand:- start:3636 stop:4268 length:633 start_codon:yes stop_codon:yes gene_type:complete
MTEENKNILVVAPHADDEVLGLGGTIAKYRKKNYNINLIICSKREQDLDTYNDAYGNYNSVKKLPFKDEFLYLAKKDLLSFIEEIYNNVKPDIIFIPNKDDFNMDHKTVYEVCEIAFRRFQDHQPREILMYEIPSSTTQSFNNNFKCNYYEALTADELQNKIDTFNVYTNEKRDIPNPRNSNGILTYAMFRGMECNHMYAEGFNLIYKKN